MNGMEDIEDALDAAQVQQVQAAFNVLIQTCATDKQALVKFVQFVKLVVGTKRIALRALSEEFKS